MLNLILRSDTNNSGRSRIQTLWLRLWDRLRCWGLLYHRVPTIIRHTCQITASRWDAASLLRLLLLLNLVLLGHEWISEVLLRLISSLLLGAHRYLFFQTGLYCLGWMLDSCWSFVLAEPLWSHKAFRWRFGPCCRSLFDLEIGGFVDTSVGILVVAWWVLCNVSRISWVHSMQICLHIGLMLAKDLLMWPKWARLRLILLLSLRVLRLLGGGNVWFRATSRANAILRIP